MQDIAIHQDQRALISLRRNEIDANSIQRFVIGVSNGLSTRRTFLAMSAFLAYGTSQAVTGLPEAGDKWLVLERTGTKAPEIVTVIRALPPLTVRQISRSSSNFLGLSAAHQWNARRTGTRQGA